MPGDLKLIEPIPELLPDFLAFCREFDVPSEIPGIGAMKFDAPAESIPRCLDYARGIGIPAGWVAADTLWAVRGERIVGLINFRHALNDYLLKEGGHVGYSVRPAERRQGIATWMLKQVIEMARARGIPRLLISCDARNKASAGVIEKCGGVFENEIKAIQKYPPGREFTRRYWITVIAD